MDTNWVIDAVHEVQGELWVDKVNETHRAGRLCPWVSTFHINNLPCQLAGTFQHGSYNAGVKVVFSDNTAWMVRFPRRGKVCDTYADEKVAMEVAALNLIYEQTTIPVPKVHAWGLAASNALDLGPFIMMDFMDGVSLDNILIDPNVDNPTRLMREDISDDDVKFIYRQMANYLLQLFELDFDRIGSLSWPGAEANSTARPLTFKVHSILQNGGVTDIKGSRQQQITFTNLVVKSKEDLTVVGVVDLEWSYIGPAQLFGSAPWWLLQDRPVHPEWDADANGSKLSHVGTRYIKHLEMFISILEEEEKTMPGHEDKELSNLVKWSQESGAMWLHMLLSSGFNDHHVFPFMQLRQHLGREWTTKEEELNISNDELEAFAARKVNELDNYDEILDYRREHLALVRNGKMSKEGFLALIKQNSPANANDLREPISLD
ncbi:predicted protein [Uncinocarpus reesii 1704]|uniref:Aminoglycoside phosphotransferase domain-containing protein n=1 Tax=Uncinocarpus reesii (strain UAMH 1704) TaxID=336963 RepID=C4JTF2_UNCRE|nr:uncharacterized protein UREG_05741 [Uncinocarpus reesii 1704]EEP80899.1 predicted protein [Uncinocarpus reesii 1704]